MTQQNKPDAKYKERRKRAQHILHELQTLFPNTKTALNHSSNWELLVSVILSAQCTDKKVNEVTEKLFKKYKTLDDYIQASPREFEKDIKQTGFYKNKTKNILAAAKTIRNNFEDKVPNSMEELLTIPGVARKTANVVLGNAFGITEGIAVDTHVKRFAQKFDLTDHTSPEKIEQDLMKIFPKEDWINITHYFIEYGRNICPARKHNCTNHPLTKIFPKAAMIWPTSKP